MPMRFATCDLCGKEAWCNIYYVGNLEVKYEAVCADCSVLFRLIGLDPAPDETITRRADG